MTMKSLISLRFISLVAHLVLAIVFITDRDFNVRICISWNYDSDEYWSKDYELTIGLSLSIVLIVLELLPFIFGISMIVAKQNLFSFCMHTIGTITFTLFMLNGWPCQLFWLIFSTTIIAPFIVELIIFAQTILLMKYTNLSYY